MGKHFYKLFILMLLSIALIQSCTESKYPGYKLSDSGVYYNVLEKSNDTTVARLTDYVTVIMSYRLDDSLLFESKKLDEELRFPMIKPMFKGDLYDALGLMSPGDSMSFVIVADSFYLNTVNMLKIPEFVTPGEAMYYDLRLIKVQTNIEYKQELLKVQNIKHKEEISNLLIYVRKNKIEIAPLQSGLYFIDEKKGKGLKPDTGDICLVRLSVSDLSGMQFYSNFNSDPLDIEYGKQFDTHGFMQGLGLMRKGGKAKFIVPSIIGVGIYGMQGVDGYTTLMYEVELVDITLHETALKQREEEDKKRDAVREKINYEEKKKLVDYIERNRISQKPLTSGMYYIESKKGIGKQANYGDIVEVHYKLYNINGELLDSSLQIGKPLKFVLGSGDVIEGWDLGIKKMSEGALATLIIPSNLAYGSKGKGKNIPSNTTLIFDVELVSVN